MAVVAMRAVTAAADRGDETARLYRKYGRQLYRYCLARLRSPEEAEDAVQSTFMRVHGALAKGVTPRLEAAWLYKIAHNVCLTRSEVNGRRSQNEEPTDFRELELAAPERTDRLDGLEEALASMPKNLRDPILLREWQGLSYAEIAASLGTSVSAVETRIFRARRHLAATLRPLFDLGLLYSSLRGLLARLRGAATTVGPAKVAVGAIAIAVGGAGVSTGVTVAGDKPTPRIPPHHAAVSRPVTDHVSVRAARWAKPLHPPTVAVTRIAVAAPETSTYTATSPASAPPAAVTTEAAAAPVASPPPPPVSTTSATAPTTVAVTTSSTVTLPLAPPVTLPVSLPVVTTVELPSVTTPIATTPAATITVPTIPALPVTVSVPTLP